MSSSSAQIKIVIGAVGVVILIGAAWFLMRPTAQATSSTPVAAVTRYASESAPQAPASAAPLLEPRDEGTYIEEDQSQDTPTRVKKKKKRRRKQTRKPDEQEVEETATKRRHYAK